MGDLRHGEQRGILVSLVTAKEILATARLSSYYVFQAAGVAPTSPPIQGCSGLFPCALASVVPSVPEGTGHGLEDPCRL